MEKVYLRNTCFDSYFQYTIDYYDDKKSLLKLQYSKLNCKGDFIIYSYYTCDYCNDGSYLECSSFY